MGGVFRVQVFVADERVVQVVQRRHPENPFVECAETQLRPTPRFVPDYKGGREFAFVVGASPDGFRPVVDISVQQACLHFDPGKFERGRRGRQYRIALRIDEIDQVGVQRVPLEIGGEVGFPPFEKRKFVGCR